MKIILDISFSKIDFEGDDYLKNKLDPKIRIATGIKQEGYQYSDLYKRGLWDGYIEYYDKKTGTFPTGLADKVANLLGEHQEEYGYQYEVIDNRPDPIFSESDMPDNITLENGIELRDYQLDGIREILKHQNGIIKYSTSAGKSYLATGLIKLALEKLQGKENITFFVPKIELYNQIKDTLKEGLGIEVGTVKSGTMNIKKVNVAMIPTVASALRTDPEKGIKLTAKQRKIKKMAKEIAPKFIDGINQRQIILSYIQTTNPKTKADQAILDELQYILDTSESDAKIKFKLKSYLAEYNQIVKDKNKKKFEKKEKMKEFLSNVLVGVYDEVHSVQSESTYNTIMACDNALVKVGLTGTLDPNNKKLIHDAQATLFRVLAEVRNKDMLEKGVIAKARVKMVPVTRVINNGNDVNILNEKNYQEAYRQGIVENEYRNALATKITQMWYNRGEVVVVVVSRIEQGNTLSAMLDKLGVPHAYIHGESDPTHRAESLVRLRQGELKVLISSTIIDEGVDISQLSVLINVAGGKSLRQLLQRVGRVIRKKQDGKNEAVIVDFLDRTNQYLYDHSTQRHGIFEEEEFDIDILE